jgi:hypothetical protein
VEYRAILWKRLIDHLKGRLGIFVAFTSIFYSYSLPLPPLLITFGIMEHKHGVDPMVSDANENDFELRSKSKLAGTDADQLEMRAMGKTQQLNVSDSFESTPLPMILTLV